jgi:Putative secretion activating protein
MSFLDALRHTLQFEGGYAHDPADRGGETFRGISRRNWPDWPGWPLIDRVKARGALTARLVNAAFESDPEMERMVAVFYQRHFWRPFEGLAAPTRVLTKLFDTAVNVGVGGSVKMLQRAVKRLEPASTLLVDGAIGPQTRAAFAQVSTGPGGSEGFLQAFCREQEAYYRRIVGRSPGQAKFLKGWLRRAAWVPV